MARKCAICGKQIDFGMQVSHSHRRTRRLRVPNLQRVRAVVNGQKKRIRVCTTCLRSGKVQRAI
ncbi:MAG: 50S ribosomal protein L28 [Clostridia bacterium 62_21]|nr:MAG: 50S ribosomal protein L28 [Clostridia bacterium 62_21]HAG07845.1 50S ribosomal protein L28 [Peptococcaceae bacterium]